MKTFVIQFFVNVDRRRRDQQARRQIYRMKKERPSFHRDSDWPHCRLVISIEILVFELNPSLTKRIVVLMWIIDHLVVSFFVDRTKMNRNEKIIRLRN